MLIGRPPAREKALPSTAAKAKFNKVYQTSNYTATHIKVFCRPYLFTLSGAAQCSCEFYQFLYENAIVMPVSNHLVCGLSSRQVFQSKDVPDKSTTPEEFIRMTKGITIATAKAVAAGNSAQQEDVIATANLSRKAISDMLTTCKVLIHTSLPEQAIDSIKLPGNMWAQPAESR